MTVARHLRQAQANIARLQRPRHIAAYLEQNRVRKLQLGAGSTTMEGWLSTDIEPAADGVIYLDVTQPFPFDDSVFDYVYSEHMIEHLPWNAGGYMLKEAYRVLKPGGTIRVATPDLAVILRLYESESDPRREQYVKWITDTFLPDVGVYKSQFAINNAFRNWGHQFLYDAETLELAMLRAGFRQITRRGYGESDHQPLRGIESHGANVGSVEMAIFETMIFEATRPSL